MSLGEKGREVGVRYVSVCGREGGEWGKEDDGWLMHMRGEDAPFSLAGVVGSPLD